MSELYQLPDGWAWKKLDEFVEIKGGKRLPNGKKLVEYKTPYPYIRVSDFNEFGSINLNSLQYITEGIYNEIKNYIISKHDIYISIAGTIGKTGIIPDELDGANLTENAARLIFDNNNFDKSYLLLFTKSRHFLEQVGLATKFVAMPKLALTRLKNVRVPLPPLEEQKSIVQKLDALFERIDKAIALLQKNVDAADNFMNSVLNDVFSGLEQNYGIQPLSNVVAINSGIALPSIFKNKENTVGEFQFFKVAQMNNDEKMMKNADLKFTKGESINFKIKLFPAGSILIPKRGGAILTNKKRMLISDASYDSNIMGLKADNNILSDEFLYFFLLSIDLSNYVDESTIPQINNKHVEMMNISIPSLVEQEQIVLYLNEVSVKVEQVKSAQQQKMQNLLDLKSSILDQAFHGKL